MKTRINGNPSALAKLNAVNPSAVKQQGTTRSLYHFVPMTADRSFEFFTNLNSTKQIYKNIDQNKLTEGEAIVVKSITFPVILCDVANDEIITGAGNLGALALVHLIAGKVDVIVGNQTVIKDYPLSRAQAINKLGATFGEQFIMPLESELVIGKDVEFKVVLKHCGIFNGVMPTNYKIGVSLNGYGKILNQKKNI